MCEVCLHFVCACAFIFISIWATNNSHFSTDTHVFTVAYINVLKNALMVKASDLNKGALKSILKLTSKAKPKTKAKAKGKVRSKTLKHIRFGKELKGPSSSSSASNRHSYVSPKELLQAAAAPTIVKLVRILMP